MFRRDHSLNFQDEISNILKLSMETTEIYQKS